MLCWICFLCCSVGHSLLPPCHHHPHFRLPLEVRGWRLRNGGGDWRRICWWPRHCHCLQPNGFAQYDHKIRILHVILDYPRKSRSFNHPLRGWMFGQFREIALLGEFQKVTLSAQKCWSIDTELCQYIVLWNVLIKRRKKPVFRMVCNFCHSKSLQNILMKKKKYFGYVLW